MEFKPNSTTVKFIRQAKALKESGMVKRFNEIADKIGWDKTALSNVMNNRRNIPDEYYAEFTKVYNPVEIDQERIFMELTLRNQAMLKVSLRALAELISKQRDESVQKTLADLEAAVGQEVQQLLVRIQF